MVPLGTTSSRPSCCSNKEPTVEPTVAIPTVEPTVEPTVAIPPAQSFDKSVPDG